MACARAVLKGARHLEKPMTDNTAQAAELVQLAQQNNCVLQVGHVERFNPAVIALKKHLTVG